MSSSALKKAFIAFGLWYLFFGVTAIFPEMQAPFFKTPISGWDASAKILLIFAGMYASMIAVLSFAIALVHPARGFCLAVFVIQSLIVPSVVGYCHAMTGMFTPTALVAFGIDSAIGLLFLYFFYASRPAAATAAAA